MRSNNAAKVTRSAGPRRYERRDVIGARDKAQYLFFRLFR